jgi:DNA-binding CsgD family transcriptional regulator/PAS domain-containing protein
MFGTDDEYNKVTEALLDAAVDPGRWTDALVSAAAWAGANSATILPLKGIMPRVPCTPSMAEGLKAFFDEGWCNRDERRRGLPFLISKGVFGDQDFATSEEIKSSVFYNEFLGRFGVRYSACVGVPTEGDYWALVLNRRYDEAPYTEEEQQRLLRLKRPLALAATMARRAEFAQMAGIADALSAFDCAAVLVRRNGQIAAMNESAERIMGSGLSVRRGELVATRTEFQASLSALIYQITTPRSSQTLQPIAIKRDGCRPIILSGAPLKGLRQDIFRSAAGLLLINDLDASPALPPEDLLQTMFGLTKAECRIANGLADGLALSSLTEQLQITHETGRSQLKSIFSKTQVKRQSELSQLLGKIRHRLLKPR